jgi:DNA repair exonuclease SbcCD nuclease subunit
MKLLITGDWHLRWGKPRYRVDDYTETQLRKIYYILDKASDFECTAILQPGDMTENYPVPKFHYRLLQRYINEFRSGFGIKTVWGQHDGNYHADFENTPLKVMEAAGAVFIYDQGHYSFIDPEEPHITLYGVGWGEVIPVPRDFNDFNILLIHKMISNSDYWSGHVAYTDAQAFLASQPYDLIVSGDNHKHFYVVAHGKILINCGSLMRTNIDQVDHQPVFYIFDTDTKTFEEHKIPIAPAEEVFDVENYERLTSDRKEVRAFVEELGRRGELDGFDFEQDLQDVLDENPNEVMARLILEEVRRKYVPTPTR